MEATGSEVNTKPLAQRAWYPRAIAQTPGVFVLRYYFGVHSVCWLEMTLSSNPSLVLPAKVRTDSTGQVTSVTGHA